MQKGLLSGQALIFPSMVGNFGHVSLPLDNSAKTNARNNAVSTASYIVALREHADVVELLFTRGAGVNCTKKQQHNKT